MRLSTRRTQPRLQRRGTPVSTLRCIADHLHAPPHMHCLHTEHAKRGAPFFSGFTLPKKYRHIETCLHAMRGKLYHIGIRHCVSRNTLAKANELRDWRIFADTAQILIPHARSLYTDEDFSQELQDATLYALDASTIHLRPSLFPWAKFRQTKAAVKLHTLMDLRGNIPVFPHISDGKPHDVNLLDLLVPEPGAYYIMDRGYLDFSRLFSMDQIGSFFITRAKKNFEFTRRYSRPVRKDGRFPSVVKT